MKLRSENRHLRNDEIDFQIHIYYDDFWFMDFILFPSYHTITK